MTFFLDIKENSLYTVRYREKATRNKDRESPILTKTETSTHRLKILVIMKKFYYF